MATEWAPGLAIAEAPDPVWAESLANAPVETISAVTMALMDLILATPDLKVPSVDHLPESRVRRHFLALVGLWQRPGDALPACPGLCRLGRGPVGPAGPFARA
ncbi:hypothetical protein [Pseudogemmobacter hezensis]|uniref:hypothetical protein n=1 Tax=Pseudogemmobacter hezensis TaxID=2737662 RepID=UPI001C12DC4D|nr:hypothetical protein [Pseudogemmobacter hezensis]